MKDVLDSYTAFCEKLENWASGARLPDHVTTALVVANINLAALLNVIASQQNGPDTGTD